MGLCSTTAGGTGTWPTPSRSGGTWGRGGGPCACSRMRSWIRCCCVALRSNVQMCWRSHQGTSMLCHALPCFEACSEPCFAPCFCAVACAALCCASAMLCLLLCALLCAMLCCNRQHASVPHVLFVAVLVFKHTLCLHIC